MQAGLRNALLALGLCTGALTRAGAQHKPPYIYGSIAAGGGYGLHLRSAVAVLLRPRHELSLAAQFFGRRAASTPSDWYAYNRTIIGEMGYPKRTLMGFSLGYGYVMYPSPDDRRLRFVAKGGLLVGRYTEPRNFYVARGLLGSAYNYDEYSKACLGLLLQPELQYVAGRGYGLSIGLQGAYANGFFNGGLQFGYVGPRRRNRG